MPGWAGLLNSEAGAMSLSNRKGNSVGAECSVWPSESTVDGLGRIATRCGLSANKMRSSKGSSLNERGVRFDTLWVVSRNPARRLDFRDDLVCRMAIARELSIGMIGCQWSEGLVVSCVESNDYAWNNF